MNLTILILKSDTMNDGGLQVIHSTIFCLRRNSIHERWIPGVTGWNFDMMSVKDELTFSKQTPHKKNSQGVKVYIKTVYPYLNTYRWATWAIERDILFLPIKNGHGRIRWSPDEVTDIWYISVF